MTVADSFYDDLETRGADEREAALMAELASTVARAKANSPYYAKLLRDFEPADVASRGGLAKLPVTRKSDLGETQRETPPFGGLNAVPLAEIARIHMSPGPLFEPDGEQPDLWRFARALHAAGFRRGDIVHNTFSYHLTPAGRLMESGARALGCPVFPAGIGNTEQQIEAVSRLRPACFAGTPSFLKILLQKGAAAGVDMSSLTKASVGGEALPPSLRAELGDLGVFVTQGYGTADLGLIAYESPAMAGMIIDEGAIVEIVRPGTGDPVPEGEVGEVVVTNFNPIYPLIRFATGDLSAVLAGPSPCGRTNMRIKGWLGRADQSTKVKGMFVHPKQISEIVERHPEIARARLVVSSIDNKDIMTLKIEADKCGAGFDATVTETMTSVLKLRGAVEVVAPGELPNDGKVIDDVRTYE